MAKTYSNEKSMNNFDSFSHRFLLFALHEENKEKAKNKNIFSHPIVLLSFLCMKKKKTELKRHTRTQTHINMLL